MRNIIKKISPALFLVPVLALGVGLFMPSLAPEAGAAVSLDNVNETYQGAGQANNLISGNESVLKTIINTMLFIIGVLSIIMLIYGGIRYTTSGGKQDSVTAAKNTILYAIVGLVVALLGYAIVNWVLHVFD